MEPFGRVEAWLGALRGRLLRNARLESLWAASAALATGLALGLGLAGVLGPGSGRWGWAPVVLGALLAAWASWALLVRPRRGWRTDADLARWTERRVDGLASGVITSVQAAAAIQAPRDATGTLAWPGFSEPLARETAGRTAARLEAVDPGSLVDTSRARRLGPLAIVGTAALAALVVLFPDLARDGARNLVFGPSEVAGVEGLREVDVVVSDLSFRLVYPAYLDLQPRDVPRSSGDLSAPAGTEVRFTGSALFPARTAALELESQPEVRWDVELSPEGVVRGRFRVGVDDRWRLELTAADGTRLREKGWRTLEAKEDEVPDIRVVLPEADLEVDPGQSVSLLFEAIDDHGLDEVALVLDRGDEAGREDATERRVVRRAAGERTARGTEELGVDSLGLAPGESVYVWFEAKDLNTVTGPGIGRSASRRIEMHSPDAEHEERLVLLEKLMEAMIDVLADRLESPVDARDEAEIDRYREAQTGVSAKNGTMLTALDALAEELKTDVLASDALRDAIVLSAGRLRDHHVQESGQLRQMATGDDGGRGQRALAEVLASLNEEGTGLLETAILELKEALDRERKDRLLEEGRDLLETQTELMDLLEKLKNGKDDALQAEADRKLDELLRKIRKMEEELGKLAERSPYENQNLQQEPSDTRKDMMSIRDRLAEVRRLLREGKVEEAMKLLEELNRNTQEMMAALQEDFGPGSAMEAEARRKMLELQMKLGELGDGQRGVREETGGARKEMDEARRREAEEALREALESARSKAKEIEEKLRQAPEAPLHPSDREALDQLRKKAESLREAVERPDVDAAREEAKGVAGSCDRLGGEIGASESRELDLEKSKGMKDAAGKVGEGGKLAKELADELDRLAEKLDRPPTPGEAKRLGELAKRQQTIERLLHGLRQELEGMESEVPGVKEELGPGLQEAGEAMKRAADRLGKQVPGEAEPHQEEAMERLREAQDAVEKRMREAQGRRSQGGPGINNPEAEVAIPEADDHRAPKAFREELLKAMKERAPERFREAIDRYYEELVK